MFAALNKLVGGGPALNFTLEEPYDSAWGCWTHYKGTSTVDNTPVSVFKLAVTDPNDLKLAAARNGVKRLKMLRHPNVLAYKDSMEVQEKGQTVVYLVTEEVQPLLAVLQELDLSRKHRDEFVATGLLHMANAVSFINNDCKMVHGNVCMAAVAVTPTLDWKLHGFDLLSEVALGGDFALQHAAWMLGEQYKPAEVARRDWAAIPQGPPWAVDSWGLGILMQEVFSGKPMAAVEDLRRTEGIPQALLQDYQRLLSSTPSRRLNPSKVAESAFLNNKLVEVVAFMENIAVKDSNEKDSFFKRLPSMVPSLPPPVATRKVLPLLARALEFGGAPPVALSSLLLIGRSLDADEFGRRVVPCLSKLFSSSDRNLRRVLLESVEQYSGVLTAEVVEAQVYPQLQSGFSDDNAYIRELTLKGMLVLAPKLKQATLTQNVLKHLSRLQVDVEPSIRANTTVLLGNIAHLLGDVYCKKVLLNAFGRALKDGFPPARVAALRALIATIKYYSAEEAATRALPAVVPLAVDVVPDVRSAALQCIDAFAALLKDNDAKLAEAAAVAGANGVPQAAQSSGSVLGWAMSSVSTLVGSSGPAVAAAPAAVTAGTPVAAAAAARPVGAVAQAPAAPAGPVAGRGGSSLDGLGGSAGSNVGGGDEGWDDDDGGLDGLLDEEEAKARSRLTTITSTSRPLAATSSSAGSATTATAPSSRSHVTLPSGLSSGWDEGDGWDGGRGKTNSGGASGGGAARARPMPAARAGAAGAAGRPKAGAMKLGASKLGAQKLQVD